MRAEVMQKLELLVEIFLKTIHNILVKVLQSFSTKESKTFGGNVRSTLCT